MASRIFDLNAKSMTNSTLVPASCGRNRHWFDRRLNGPYSRLTSTVRAEASRRTRVANFSRRNEKPTWASASTVETWASARPFQVRMAVIQGTNCG